MHLRQHLRNLSGRVKPQPPKGNLAVGALSTVVQECFAPLSQKMDRRTWLTHRIHGFISENHSPLPKRRLNRPVGSTALL
jgi:hypothetical protein